MASYFIHIAVAKEINKKLQRDEGMLLFGAVAPDVSKCANESRIFSHFLDDEDNNIPNIDRFLDKYKHFLNDDFVMGYFIHLYTDYLWYKYFISEINKDGTITKLDGSVVKLNGNMAAIYIYNDYTNLNIRLIESYDLDLEKLKNGFECEVKHIIDEIPYDKMDLLFNNMCNIISGTKNRKEFVFNIDNINRFIGMAVELIYSEIEDVQKIINLKKESSEVITN